MTTRADRPLAPVAGIVLAGGRASRFGRDKLAEPMKGRPLLHHALLALAPVVAEIVLVVRPDVEPPVLPALSPAVPVRLVRDPVAFGGPLVALLTALETIDQPVALVVGGDMPALRPAVLEAMVRALAEGSDDIMILAGPGPMQTMPAAIRVGSARAAAREATAAGSRALRALFDRVTVAALPEVDWRALDPDGATLRDVDHPADLQDPGT